MGKLEKAKEDIKTRSPGLKKTILVYTIELLVFSVVFIVLGILELLGIIGNNLDWRTVFTYITLVGVVVFLGLTIWTFADPRRRAKAEIIDRVMLIPGPVAVLFLDIMTLVKGAGDEGVQMLHRYIIGIVFIYFGLCYIFQAVYHYFFPVKMLLEAEEEEKRKAEEEKLAAEASNEVPSEEVDSTKSESEDTHE